MSVVLISWYAFTMHKVLQQWYVLEYVEVETRPVYLAITMNSEL